MANKELVYASVASLIIHLLFLVGFTWNSKTQSVQVTPSYEVSLVHVKVPKKKIRRKPKKTKKPKKKIKKKVRKKKRSKPILKDTIKVAVPKKPPPPKAPPPPPKKEPPPKPVSRITRQDGAASQLSVESTSFPYQFYVDIIHRKIMSNWFPDSDYVKPGSEISILVYFRVQKTGDLAKLKLVSGSGEEILDKSAISAILNARPLPPLPDQFEDAYLGVNFRFILHGVEWGNDL